MKPTIPLILILALVVLAGCVEEPIKTGCDLEDWYSDKECCKACEQMGYSYLHSTYSSSGWGHEQIDDCFCRSVKESIQIY